MPTKLQEIKYIIIMNNFEITSTITFIIHLFKNLTRRCSEFGIGFSFPGKE